MTIAYSLLQDYLNTKLICVTENASQAEKLRQELLFLYSGLDKTIVYLSDYELSFEEPLSPSSSIVSQRLKILNQLLSRQIDILIVTAQTAMTRLPPKSFVQEHVFQFKPKETIQVSKLVETLVRSGYQRMSQVSSHQTFSQRGSIIDFFPPHSKHPIRIELDDNTIDNIHYFDIHTQRSLDEPLSTIDITPPYEYSPKKEATTGWHRYLPEYHDHLDTLLDYHPNATWILNTKLDLTRSDLPKNPDYLITAKDIQTLQQRSKPIQKEHLSTQHIELSLDKKTVQTELKNLLSQKSILFVCQSYFRMNQLESLLLSQNIDFKHVKHFYEFSSKKINLGICLGTLPEIIHLEDAYIIPEQNVIEKTILQDTPKAPSLDVETLKVGELMIHSDHGIGRFIGIETHTINTHPEDFVVVEYAHQDRLMFPPDQLTKIHPYRGDSESLDELRSSRWKKRKQKAMENIELFAAKLLKLQTQRNQKAIEPIPLPENYDDFTADFPFTETKDQLSIMEHIIHDYQKTTLFNRLVCGDVGFGKTEIAMRSAFIALQNGYQVALITPTTVLATQHYNNFKDRFKRFGISMALISRSNQKSETEKLKIETGETQLIIGTHGVLSLAFDKLGLVIIDEEHRFGVRQKDSVQAFQPAHKLSLTATPIPRSLNMALSKLRSVSIMSTPPKSRLPIQTIVDIENDTLVQAALEREIHRGGQAYIIYNDVKNMDAFHKKMHTLCPHLTFGIVHGQMPASSIEKQMARFHSQGFQVLIASTIIESGLDIPNANTIIVYRADKLGLAQLHQIRGRVGRSHHQAYAYLLTPENIAQKATLRLNAIEGAMKLGSGFQLSVADLEIRGAGNLLGQEQSGHVNAIGLSYYTHLLNQATHTEVPFETEIDLDIPKIIPDSYILDTESRYQIYHKLANCHDEKTLSDIADELSDRYGKIPESTQNLIQITQLRIQASAFKIKSIQSRQRHILLDFGSDTTINTQKLLELIQKHDEYSLGGPSHIKIETDNPIQASQILFNRISR